MDKKPLILVVATIFFGALFLIILKSSIYSFDYTSISYWARILIFFGIYGGLAVLSALILKKRIYLIEVLGVMLIYWLVFGFNEIYLAAGLIFLLFNFIYLTRITKEKEDRVNLSIRKIIYPRLEFFILSLIVLISIGYYFLPLVQLKAEIFEIPANVIEGFENVSYNFIINTAPPDFISQPEANKGFDTRINDAVNRLLGWTNFLAVPYLKYFPIVLASGLFLLLSAFTWLWKLIILLFASIIFKVFRKTEFLKVELKNKKVERIKL